MQQFSSVCIRSFLVPAAIAFLGVVLSAQSKAQSNFVQIMVWHEYENNLDPGGDNFSHAVFVGKSLGNLGELTSVSVTPPGGPTMPLAKGTLPGWDGWGLEEWIEAPAPITGVYVIHFNSATGSDTAFVGFNPTPSTAHAIVTKPEPNGTTSIEPLFEWNSVAGAGQAIWARIQSNEDEEEEDLLIDILPTSQTSWEPDIELEPGIPHILTLVVYIDEWSAVTSSGGEQLNCISSYWRANYVDFTPTSLRVVLGDAGLPIANAQIQIAPEGTTDWQDPVDGGVFTNDDGYASLAEVDNPGRYHVRAVAFHLLEENLPFFMSVANYPDWDPSLVFQLGEGKAPEIPEIKFPSPVVLQGGLFSGLGAWGGKFPPEDSMLGYLRDDPATNSYKRSNHLPAFICFPVPSLFGDLNPKGYNNLLPREDSHDKNAKVLANWMRSAAADLVEQSPSDGRSWVSGASVGNIKFDIVCHSMGGLISRALTTSSDSMGAQVRMVVSLDGVHCGTNYALWGMPGSGFNEWFLNGTALLPGWNASHLELDMRPPFLLYSCAATPSNNCKGDWIVTPDKSAFGVGRIWPISEARFVRGPEVAVSEHHTEINSNPQRARQASQFLAFGRVPAGTVFPSATCTTGATCIPDTGCDSSSALGPSVEMGHLSGRLEAASGTTATAVLAFDSNSTIECQLMLVGGGGTYTFEDDSGAAIAWTLLESQALATDVTLDRVEFPSPQAGPVKLALSAAGNDVELDYDFQFSNGRALMVTLPTSPLSAGEPLLISASVVDSQGAVVIGSNGVLVATVTDPEGTETQVQLVENGLQKDSASGNGVFSGSFVGTATEGYYSVFVSGMTALGAEWVVRSGSASAAVAATGAHLIGAPLEGLLDPDGNQLANALELSQPVAFTKDGNYRVLADLETGSGDVIAELHVDVERTTGPGTQDVVFTISAEELAMSGSDGPWFLDGRRIVNMDAGCLETDSGSDYSTGPYALSQFEVPLEPGPTILIPSSGPKAGGYSVNLQGTGLGIISGVYVNGVQAEFVVHSDNAVEITIPALATSGQAWSTKSVSVDLRVTTPWHDVTYEDAFVYKGAAPVPR